MPALPLDDKRWVELWSSEGPARNMPQQIAYLLEHPDDIEALGYLNNAACSDGMAWSGGFAAMPYLVDVARKLAPAKRRDVLATIGWIVTAASFESDDAHAKLEPYLEESYHQAIRDCQPLLAEAMQCEQSERDFAGLLFTAAALNGHPQLAAVLANLDSCEHCSGILGWS
jgi:pimeloyl-ACP methyl ester carboxylesterase